jgi:transcriptional regulator with XRE-family HTH domain
MFINKSSDGRNNVCGKQIAQYRVQQGLSQRELADKMQLVGIDIDKNAIQRIECGKRFVTDIELTILANVLNKSYEELLRQSDIAESP